MSYIAWDTETTGVPMTRHGATPENTHIFDSARVVSLAFVKFSSHGREYESYHSLVYPDTFGVKATEIHGISHEQALTHGKLFHEVYNDFVKATEHCKTCVAYNSQFDKNVFFSECYRRELSVEPFKDVKWVCAYELTKEKFLKTMKLAEIYNLLIGGTFDAHNALADSRACGEVYHVLRQYTRTFKELNIPRVILKASDVASIIDKNPYKKPLEIITNMWCKYSPETFKGKTKDQIGKDAINSCGVAQRMLEDAEKFKSTDSSSVEQKYRAITNQMKFASDLEMEQLEAANEYIRKTLYTNHGTRHEDTVADAHDNFIRDDTFYTYEVCTIEGTKYEIVGRIDRLVADENGGITIVEIKNRTKNLFRSVREYENIQCQAYMEMLNISHCKLIEKHNDKMCTHLLERNKEKWDGQILPKLKNFCEHFHSLLSK